MATGGHNSTTGSQMKATKVCTNSCHSESTMVTNTESSLGNNDREDSDGSISNSSISDVGSRCDGSGTNEEGVRIVPLWKDDCDDSSCSSITNNYYDEVENQSENPTRIYLRYGQIPSTLEFSVPKKTVDDGGKKQPLASPSSVRYSPDSHGPLRVDISADCFPSLPIISIPSDSRLDTLRKKGVSVDDEFATNISRTKQRNNFRRRMNFSSDSRSADTNPLPGSQSSFRTSSTSSRCSVFTRRSPRFVLMFGAMILVMLSVHDNIKSSRQFYRQQYISNRREEIAFPLVQVQVHSETADNIEGDVRENQNVELPKFYFPKTDHPNTIRGSAGRSGNNLVMARSQRARPMFVPDSPLPDGGFRKPLERFVFDAEEQQKQEKYRHEHRILENDTRFSWTTCMASLTLMVMFFDTCWKEYRRYRSSILSSSRDD